MEKEIKEKMQEFNSFLTKFDTDELVTVLPKTLMEKERKSVILPKSKLAKNAKKWFTEGGKYTYDNGGLVMMRAENGYEEDYMFIETKKQRKKRLKILDKKEDLKQKRLRKNMKKLEKMLTPRGNDIVGVTVEYPGSHEVKGKYTMRLKNVLSSIKHNDYAVTGIYPEKIKISNGEKNYDVKLNMDVDTRNMDCLS